MAGSAVKKKGKRARCAPRIKDSCDSNSDAPWTQARSPPDKTPQHLEGSPNMPSKRQKNVADDSSEENASVKDLPAEVRVTGPQFSGIFDSWKEMEAAFVRYQRGDVSELEPPNDKLD
ncbi:hypothetical protein JG687_00017416 [Phytophthora cactorum]|uniref:Uncharacterized protein n=1 Tax=Phytophthora cactorum TaxID=29920 RepID=A0A329SRF2_9STRA|nr:hypothetical protein Pcac1_g61 [Phytophthora cactorum]KAG2796723.1 hypothetical protein PC111_g21602 [Phytophthora cactorum]KAG2796943.1 hypothetical protein PC112_g21997 [Phytophthora cactorum]KAG2825378.1 hypothetical protein PC113_g21918 [Phytophthora cactorum]KAG2876008.1 hypothetical protein PC114_g24412 [Phytophthora cactorum]